MDLPVSGIVLVLKQSGLLLFSLLPYVLAGAAAGALLKKASLERLHMVLSRVAPIGAVPVAAVSGAVSPLCTLGSVPLVTGFISKGLTASAGVAFLVTSSIITPQMVLIAAGVMGWRIACLQILGGLLLGSIAGWGAMALSRSGSSLLRADIRDPEAHAGKSTRPLIIIFLEQLEYVLFFLLVGVVVSQALSVFLPLESWAESLDRHSFLAVAVGALLSVPAYVCGGAALPVLGSLHDSGLGEGIIIAFLICGPATRVQSIAAVAKLFNRRGLVLYVAFILIFSILYGFGVGFLDSFRG